MALVLLRTQCTPGGPGEFLETKRYYNTDTFQTEDDQPVLVFACTPYERQLNEVVHTFCREVPGRPSDARQTLFKVVYLGNGQVGGEEEANSTSCPLLSTSGPGCDLRIVRITPTQPSAPGLEDGGIAIEVFTSNPPLVFLLNGTTNTTGGQTGVYTGLRAGNYTGVVEDAAGCQTRFGPIELRGDARFVLKSDAETTFDFSEDPPVPTGYQETVYEYDFITRVALPPVTTVYGGGSATPPDFSHPVTDVIDEYLLPDGLTYRRVYHDGEGGIRFVDSAPPPPPPPGGGNTGQPGQLRFVNIIRSDIDEAGTSTGAVLLEATNDGVGGAITYTLVAGGGQASRSNQTGGFSALSAGEYTFRAQDESGQTVEQQLTLADAYAPRWRLLTQDVERTSLEVVILERDYPGEAEAVCAAAATPVARRWEGAGNDPLAEIPELVGSSLTLQLLASNPRPFAVLATGDDRRHRVDVYRSGQLEGRYYVVPDLLRVQVHEALPTISITATDGLGGLRDTLFENHLGQRVTYGRWPVLHTILHALSRTDTNLPLYVNVHLRDVLMSDTTEPLAATAHDREAYGSEGDIPLVYDVLTALLRPFNACLWQARGAWWIASPLDMALAAEEGSASLWTAYNMAGQVLATGPQAGRALDLWAVKNPGELTQPRHLEWAAPGAEQATTAAAKVVQATVKLQLRESNLPSGELQEWNPAGTLPLFWLEGPVLRVPGPKAGTYAMRLPAGATVLTPPMQTLPGDDYSPVLLKLTARCLAPKPDVGPTPDTAMLLLTVLTDGQPDPELLRFNVPRGGSEAKMQEYSLVLPATRTGFSIRVRLENGSEVPLEIGYVRLQILPALVEWPEADTQTVVNPEGVLLVPTITLVHADQPRLATSPDTFAPSQGMDVLAWKHAFTLVDGRATTRWRRPGVRQPAPLLDTAALDVLQQRAGEQRTLGGTLLGYAGIGGFSFGQLVVSPDARGLLLWVVSCELDDEQGSATVVLRPIGRAPEAQLPPNSRVTTAGAVRVTTDGAIRVYVP